SGRGKESGQYFRLASLMWEELLAKVPDNESYQDGLARCLFHQAPLRRRAGKPDEAEEDLLRCKEIWRQLHRAQPSPDDQYDLARTHLHLGLLFRETDRHPEALKALEKALAYFEALERARPGHYSRDLLRVLRELRSQHFAAGKVQEARAAHQRMAD